MSDTRMGGNQKGGLVKKSLGDTGLPKPQTHPTLKPVTQKGIMAKGGSLGAGTPLNKNHSIKGFTKGGMVQP